MKKQRLDVLLTEQGLAPSRERAKAIIMAGVVLIDGQRVDKPGALVMTTAVITIKGDPIGYVSRGGLKLAKALDFFKISLEGKVVGDIGASTGGFTDCALKNGAVRVFAIDVGYGQLAWQLRNDSRVVNMERTNIRYVTPQDIGVPLDFISIDVAFISLAKVLPAAKKLLSNNGYIVALIKPQFEAGKEKVGKKGVVKDPTVHEEVIRKVLTVAETNELYPAGITYSPIKGPEGNIEYLLYLTALATDLDITDTAVTDIVAQAHSELKK